MNVVVEWRRNDDLRILFRAFESTQPKLLSQKSTLKMFCQLQFAWLLCSCSTVRSSSEWPMVQVTMANVLRGSVLSIHYEIGTNISISSSTGLSKCRITGSEKKEKRNHEQNEKKTRSCHSQKNKNIGIERTCCIVACAHDRSRQSRAHIWALDVSLCTLCVRQIEKIVDALSQSSSFRSHSFHSHPRRSIDSCGISDETVADCCRLEILQKIDSQIKEKHCSTGNKKKPSVWRLKWLRFIELCSRFTLSHTHIHRDHRATVVHSIICSRLFLSSLRIFVSFFLSFSIQVSCRVYFYFVILFESHSNRRS